MPLRIMIFTLDSSSPRMAAICAIRGSLDRIVPHTSMTLLNEWTCGMNKAPESVAR